MQRGGYLILSPPREERGCCGHPLLSPCPMRYLQLLRLTQKLPKHPVCHQLWEIRPLVDQRPPPRPLPLGCLGVVVAALGMRSPLPWVGCSHMHFLVAWPRG